MILILFVHMYTVSFPNNNRNCEVLTVTRNRYNGF